MARIERARTTLPALVMRASAPITADLASRRTFWLAQVALVLLYLLLWRLIGAPLPLPARAGGCQAVPFPC